MRLLAGAESHLHYFLTEDLSEDVLIARHESLLTDEERARWRRFVFAHSRHEFLSTRALVRTTLSRYAEVDPRDWRFRNNPWGCPEIAGPDAAPPLRFNLSNTKGLVTCAVTVGAEVGVDVECLDRRAPIEVADRYFAPLEVSALRALPDEEQPLRFFEYWTLKESYIKARGMGLAIRLDQFGFRLDPPPSLAFSTEPALGDDAASWRFGRLRLTPRHLCAIALRRRQEVSREVVMVRRSNLRAE